MSHVTVAASANTFGQMFNALRQNFTFAKTDSANWGPFSANYSVKLHLENGSIALNNGNNVEIAGVDIVWDTLKCGVCLDLPGFCVGGWCIIPDPFDGCWVSLPKLCIGGPICIEPDLSGLVSSISDIKANLLAKYFIDPARTPGETDLDAEFNGHPNKWRIFLNPLWVLVDPIDIPATIDNIFENLLKSAIDGLLWFLPGWAQDLLWSLIGPVLDPFKSIIGIAGSISDWLSNLLGNQFGLLGLIETAVADYFANRDPIYEFEDPYPILAGTGGLIPVKIPIRDLAIDVNSNEMTLAANIGA